jgi:hypothetical protein
MPGNLEALSYYRTRVRKSTRNPPRTLITQRFPQRRPSRPYRQQAGVKGAPKAAKRTLDAALAAAEGRQPWTKAPARRRLTCDRSPRPRPKNLEGAANSGASEFSGASAASFRCRPLASGAKIDASRVHRRP